jgi:ABC-type transporter Mla subunit MlaD
VLSLRRTDVTIDFADVSYFWGQMGAGKTSIARMIDYCLGGDIQLSPAMQSEFAAAALNLSLARDDVKIERPRDSDRVIASWGTGHGAFQLSLPARRAEGEVMQGTGVEQLSDLLFWLSGVTPPRVRKSKVREDSETARLSIRDLLWYCYLDQDEIDSSFFQLEESAPFYKRNKSRDVLRYVIGFHDERIADIEAALDQLRGKRQALGGTIAGLMRALTEVGVESEAQISERIATLRSQADRLQANIETARDAATAERQTTHAVDQLRDQARSLGEEIARTEDAIVSLRQTQERDKRHLHEIETLSLKFKRSISAKAVLVGVAFESCPRCAQRLPERDEGRCAVCGQPDQIEVVDSTEVALVERDTRARIAELTDIVAKHDERLFSLKRDRDGLVATKARMERERNEALARYDTAYLSTMLTTERERAALLQEAENPAGLRRLPHMLDEQRAELTEIAGQEQRLRTGLREARAAAESDETNLRHLKNIFLDCLVRAGVPGITVEDRVEIPTPSFFPEVYGPDPDEKAVSTFGTLSSGGKKTLFKCCFAIAVHRLAVKLEAPLPELLIIDSPMKNISERENRDQFEDFYRLLYDLKDGELRETQMVLIDKEFSAPDIPHLFTLFERHMRPGDKDNPPLIPYYDGK